MREFDTHGEAPQQQRLHRHIGGTMVREFPVVRGKAGGTREQRWIDSVVLPDSPELTVGGQVTDYVLWKGKYIDSARDLPRLWERMRREPVVCVQAKRHRLGPRLLGQALFSRGLLEAQGVDVVRTIASCGATEPELEAIASEDFGIDVIPDRGVRDTPEPMNLLVPHPTREEFLATIEADGARVQRWFPGLRGSRLQVEAIAVRGSLATGALGGWSDLAGLDVTVVVTTDQRLCMYSLGMAVFMRALAERCGARATAVVLARGGDSALEPLLEAHPDVRLEIAPVS